MIISPEAVSRFGINIQRDQEWLSSISPNHYAADWAQSPDAIPSAHKKPDERNQGWYRPFCFYHPGQMFRKASGGGRGQTQQGRSTELGECCVPTILVETGFGRAMENR